MKKILFLAAAFVAGFTVMAQQKAAEVIKVNIEKYDFGKIKQGVPVTTYFTITNTSDKPVVIENAFASCGCTTPEYSKEPIAPNGTSKLKVGYNAASLNSFTKPVTIKVAGFTEPVVVNITGNVLDAAAFDAYAKTDEYKKMEEAKMSGSSKDMKAEAKASKKAKKGKATPKK